MSTSTVTDGALRVDLHIAREGRGQSFNLDVSFVAKPGITILFGDSGSGKSTTLQLIAGLARPDRGRVRLGNELWFDSETRVDRPAHERHVAFVFQSLALFPHMTAARNVAYGIDRVVARDQRMLRARTFLDRLGVGHLADRKPRTFSGGEAQRVALARALAMSPRIILLDEPFSALNQELRVQLATLVRDLVDELEIPLIQVTHNQGEARALGDYMIRLEAGRIIEQGTVEELLGDPRATLEKAGRFEHIGKTPMPELRRKR